MRKNNQPYIPPDTRILMLPDYVWSLLLLALTALIVYAFIT